MTSVSAAAARELARRAASKSFAGFVDYLHPEWERPAFHEELIETLDALERGELYNEEGHLVTNLMVNMPPRHSKSTYCTVLFPIYYLGRDPRRHNMIVNYNSLLAKDFGRTSQVLVRSDEVQEVFPNLEVNKSIRGWDAWRTTAGGNHFSIGLNQTTSGRPANLLVMDDLIKNRKEANSRLVRDDVWNYYVAALDARLEPTWDGKPPIRIVVMTRWHTDDVCGRIMQTESWKRGEWKHIIYPGILDEDRRQTLWPERFGWKFMTDKRRLNPVEFSALYQQQPYVMGGELLMRKWWRYYPKELVPEQFVHLIVLADPAVKAAERNDPSALMAMGVTEEGHVLIVDVVKMKVEFHELKNMLIFFAQRFRGRGLRGVYIEDAQSGGPLIQELKRETQLPVLPWKSYKDKVTRVKLVQPMIESGTVYLPEGALWVPDFLEECEQFPNGAYDDQVDVLTMGLDIISRMAIPMQAFDELQGESLLEEYNRMREQNARAFEGRRRNQSLNALAKNRPWAGWGG